MLKWFKKVVLREEEKSVWQKAKEEYEDIGKSINRKISEPVMSIVKTFDEKGRWKIKCNHDMLRSPCHAGYDFTFTDTKTDEKFVIKSYSFYFYGFSAVFPKDIYVGYLPSWLTLFERKWVADQISLHMDKLEARIDRVNKRADRMRYEKRTLEQNKERTRLMNVYCKEK